MSRQEKTSAQAGEPFRAPRHFPGFDGDWARIELRPFLVRHLERVPADTDLRIYSSSREGLLPQDEYYGGHNRINDGEYGVVPEGHFVYRHMSDDTTFKFNINNTGQPIAVSKEYPVFTTDGVDSTFLRYLLNESYPFKQFAAMQRKGGTRTRLYFEALCSWCAPLPSLPEQERIAECLASLDTLIEAETEKLDALRDHKQGLMQQLFPAEGESLPALRFPKFVEHEDWTFNELGPMTEKVGSGVTPKGGEANYKASGRPFLRSQNVGWGFLILDDVAHIDETTHQNMMSTELIKGDVLLNITGASIGRSAIADNRVEGGNVNQHVCIIRVKPEELNPKFVKQYLLSSLGQSQIDKCQAGGNRQGLNFQQIRSFNIPLPPTLDEQRIIASALQSADEFLAERASKLETLKNHKQGLLQQLFPALDEVDG